ncbi:MAG: hypothetical protein LBV69_12005 [Bacteroidales bacterium]|jgi:hypothetical protein|nr:hypothetical protein [Bacteroidales bacterium]
MKNKIYRYEYGHYLDGMRWGPIYLFAIGMPSIISGGKATSLSAPPFTTHRSYWTERRANRRAKKYFEKHLGIDWNGQHPNGKGEIRIDEDGNQYYYYYIIEDYYPTY